MMNFYCSKCGAQLKREERIVPLSDSEAEMEYLLKLCLFESSFSHKIPDEKKEHVLVCSQCESEFIIEEQKIYSLLQREYNKKVLTDNDFLNNEIINTQVNKLHKRNIILFLISILFLAGGFAYTAIFWNKIINDLYFAYGTFVFLFVFEKLNLVIKKNKIKKHCLLNIRNSEFSIREYYYNANIKKEIINRSISLFLFALGPLLLTYLSINSYFNQENIESIIYVIAAVVFWIVFFVGLTRTIKLVKLIKQKKHN